MKKSETYNSPVITELLKGISPEEFERTEKKMQLAVHIDEAIKAKGWKKSDLAKALKKTPSEISKWLSGTHNFTSDTLFDIERVLNVHIINVDCKPERIVKTYRCNITVHAPMESYHSWQSVIYDKSVRHLFKAKAQLNSCNS